MYDFMYKADDKAAWDQYIESLPERITSELAIDEIGPVVITPAVFDNEGNIITPAVLDLAHHVNARYLGTDEADAEILATSTTKVKWISPDTVSTPNRIWAGGMNYYD